VLLPGSLSSYRLAGFGVLAMALEVLLLRSSSKATASQFEAAHGLIAGVAYPPQKGQTARSFHKLCQVGLGGRWNVANDLHDLSLSPKWAWA
jgi:hypothetical protein